MKAAFPDWRRIESESRDLAVRSVRFLGDVASRYGHPDLDPLLAKLRYYAVMDQIGTILEDAGHALPGQKETAWRRVKQLLA